MRHSKTCLILLSSIVFGLANVFAQTPDINKAFTTYKTKFPASRLHLAFNQPSYAAGDTIFFTAWHLDESQKLLPGRQVGSIDLIAENGHAVERIHFKIEDGRASNQLVLSKNIVPGVYTIVAYTNWMRNFDNDWFYQKRIEINGRNEISSVAAPMTAGVEGGSLVAGITNHVVVTFDFPGATVSIRNQANEDVATASLDSTGVASMNITPVVGAQYTVIGPGGFKTNLPSVKESGVAIKLSAEALTMESAGQYKDNTLLLVFTSQGKIADSRRVEFHNGAATATLPNTLKGLFQQLYVIDQTGVVVAERVFATQTSREEIGRIASSGDVSQRQNVTMLVELPTGADVSVSAYQQNLFDINNLRSSFYLSELPVVLRWAEKYPKYQKSLNTFLVTQHWARINWTEILSGQDKKIPFPYHNILTKKGMVKSRITGQPVPDSTNVIVYLQRNTMGYDTYTRNGRFEVPFAFDFWGNDFLFVALQRKSRDISAEYEIVFDADSLELPAIAPGKQLTSESTYGTYAMNKQLIAGSYSFFGKETQDVEDNSSPNDIFEDEIGGASYEVNVEKYVVFPTMEDLLREVIPFVQFRKRGIAEGVRMMMRYPQGNKVSKGSPLFVVDGVMTRDTKYFLGLKPKDIVTVKLANDPSKLLQLGKIGENGIVLIESKKGNLADSLRKASNVQVTGLNPVVPFHNLSQIQTNPAKRVPDLRSTLFWQPKATPDSSGKVEVNFVTGDDVGPVTLVVQGMTSDGIPIFLERQVDVKYRRQP